MALLQDSTGYYLDPTSGQYYSSYQKPAPVQSYGGFWMGGMGQPVQPYGFGQPAASPMSNFGFNYNSQPADPAGMITQGDKYYVPFTGTAKGITEGKRSMVDTLIGNATPYQYNVPSMQSMFPALQGQPQGQFANKPDYNVGANRFLGGLLGSMPTPVSSTTTQAPSTSGAGRFL